ncbi:MAG: hypothetical protein ACJ757_16920 [Gaiellaceae bacterium]
MDTEARQAAGMHDNGMVMQADTVQGLAVSANGFTLALGRRIATPGRRFQLTFRILDERGRTLRDFDVKHTKRLHLVVVRRDMIDFQHLHPTQAADGSWATPLTLHEAGSYRVFADFSTADKPYVLADELLADGTVVWQALPAPTCAAEADGFRIGLDESSARAGEESELGFAVTHNRRPVQLQDYLGAKGHLVALRRGDLAYLHVHPDADRLKFMAKFPTAGTYRLFLQFKVDDAVHTAAFTQEVSS